MTEPSGYIVTGVDTSNKRFSMHFHNRIHAMSFNLYRGTVWEVKDGKRTCIKRVWN